MNELLVEQLKKYIKEHRAIIVQYRKAAEDAGDDYVKEVNLLLAANSLERAMNRLQAIVDRNE